jgi:hypothetical protein
MLFKIKDFSSLLEGCLQLKQREETAASGMLFRKSFHQSEQGVAEHGVGKG